MKIRFLKDATVDVETRHGEVYDKCFKRWSEIRVDDVYLTGTHATLQLENGDLAIGVPVDTFERIHEEKRTLSI